MPLDDIFYREDHIKSTLPERLLKRWKIIAYILLFLAYISMNMLISLHEGISLDSLLMGIPALLCFSGAFGLPLGQLFAFFVPYQNLTTDQRANLYYYWIESLVYFIIIVMCWYGLLAEGSFDTLFDSF